MEKVTVNEHADVRDLARSVITQAVRDLKNRKNPVKALDALFWMTDPASDFGLWCEVLDAPFMDPFKMLSSGGARKLRG